MRRRSPRRLARLSTEQLERRDLMAVSALTATISSQVLTLVGDDLDSALTLLVSDNSVVLTPASDTSINGAAAGEAVTLPGVARSLKADLKGGDDSLAFDSSAPLSLPGGMTVQLGSGNNQLQLSTPNHKVVLGAVSIAAGAGDDDVTIASQAGGTVSGGVSLKLGDGGCRVSLQNLIATGPLISVEGGTGRDLVTISGLTGTGVLAITAGLGVSEARITGSTLGAVSVSAEEPSLTVETSTLASTKVSGQFDTQLVLAKATVTGGVSVSATAIGGDVDLLLQGFAVGGDLSATTKGAGAAVRVTLDAAGGAASSTGNLLARATGQNASVALNVNSEVDFTTARSVTLQAAGAGGSVRARFNGLLQARSAALAVTASGVGGTVAVENPGGFRVLSAAFAAWGDAIVAGADAGASSVACQNDLSVRSTQGSARLEVPAALDARGVTVDGRRATFSFGGSVPDADDVRGQLTVRGRQQAEVVVAPGGLLNVLGGLFCTAGLDASLRAEDPASTLEVGGACTLGGTSVETIIGSRGRIGGAFAVRATRRSGTAIASEAFTFVQQASVTGGSGDDAFQSGSGVQFRSALSLRLGNGHNTVAVTGATDPTRRPTVVGPVVIVTGSGTDQINFVDAAIAGSVSCTTGAGADEFNASKACTFVGNVTDSLGGGRDSLSLAVADGGSAPVTFQGTLAARLGAENDILRLGVAQSAGGDASSRVEFTKAGSTIKGDAGINVFDRVQSQYGGLPDGSITGFSTEAT